MLDRGQKNQNVSSCDLCEAFVDITKVRMSELWETALWLDCRAASDPESRGFKHHTGEHPEIMWHVARTGANLNWFRNARRHCHERTSRFPGKPLYLMCYCRAGKHRSVATAMLLYETLRRTARYLPSAPIALVPWGPQARCGGAPRCRECSARDHARAQEACERAFTNWGRVDVPPAQ